MECYIEARVKGRNVEREAMREAGLSELAIEAILKAREEEEKK